MNDCIQPGHSGEMSENARMRGAKGHMFGVFPAMVTPFRDDGSIDIERATAHASRLIARGADGVTLCGTTGEGASIGIEERTRLLDGVLGEGVSPDSVTFCVCATSVDEAAHQASLALDRGIRKLLLTPPFYFKSISDDALFSWCEALFERIKHANPQVILYHIPQVTQVSFSHALIRRLKQAHGDLVFGVKDSAGVWENTEQLLKMDDMAILVGDERLLARAAPLGGAGAISGIANILPERVSRLVHEGESDSQLDTLVDEIVQAPVTPLVKALVGELFDEPGWERTRPPLDPADPQQVKRLAAYVRSFVG
ncbi:dihydrodipicolinate synthase family protein [Aidingimonas lacisalsi]|uniref:dihydrodipicolinate synthase family protein n=1 Tax=Aidingimonas lacisalsi TaxID=2604086 RepID=UPI0013763542|nr:dihydrodipicolinate synthase family protein [Aidingimonas lacisalsi]